MIMPTGSYHVTTRMAIWVGTSGYNYPEWKGSFYPEKLPAAKMLPYYAERLSTVEINYTYYRTPNKKILEGWSLATPERFKLTLKAPQRITHQLRRTAQFSCQLLTRCQTAVDIEQLEQVDDGSAPIELLRVRLGALLQLCDDIHLGNGFRRLRRRSWR